MVQTKRKPGRPAKGTSINIKTIAQTDLGQLVDEPKPVAGLMAISEEEYNRINGIDSIGTPDRVAAVVSSAPYKEKEMRKMSTNKVGTFVVVNTPNIKGVRLNLEKVRTYARAGQNSYTVQISWDNGTSSAYDFGNDAAAGQFLDLLDSYCL